MQTYVFSGNKQWLYDVKKEYGDNIIVSTDYNLLLKASNQPDTIVATLHDPDSPMDTKGIATPFLLNEMRHTEPGTHYSDIFINKATTKNHPVTELKAQLQDINTVQNIMTDIQNGKYHIQYSGWSFSGGRGEDAQMFDIIDNQNQKIGHIDMIEDDDVNIQFRDFEFFGQGWYTRSSPAIMQLINDTIQEALPRDDKDICAIITAADGNLCFPMDYGDISREDLLTHNYEMNIDTKITAPEKNNRPLPSCADNFDTDKQFTDENNDDFLF